MRRERDSWIIQGMPLAENQLRFLRGRAHALKPIVMIGQSGLTAGVVSETERALGDHELIKVRVRGADRAARDSILANLAARTTAELVTRIGHVAVFYRQRDTEPRLPLPEPAGATAQT
jgi:RNA-binding protein